MENYRIIKSDEKELQLENPLTRASRELFQVCAKLGSVASAPLAAHLGIDEDSVASRFKRAKEQIETMYPEVEQIHDRTEMLFLVMNAGWITFVPKNPSLAGEATKTNRKPKKRE